MTCACGRHHGPSAGHGRPAPIGDQIALSGQLRCADAAQLMAVLTHLPDHVAASRAEAGCLHFDIAQTDDPLVWQVEELFTGDAALKAHKARTMESPWAAATAGIARDIHRIDAA